MFKSWLVVVNEFLKSAPDLLSSHPLRAEVDQLKSRVHLFCQSPLMQAPAHSDHHVTERQPHKNEFLWLQFHKRRPFFILDSTGQKAFIDCQSMFFNEMDMHGSDAGEEGYFSFRVDGVFTDSFRKKLGIDAPMY